MTTRPKIVAVDGPAGSGKSSICQRVADAIGWTYVNTGALYRAVGLLATSAGLSLDDEAGLATMVDEVAPDLRWDPRERRLFFKSQDLTPRLGSEEAGYGASKVAKQALVRSSLLPVQRQMTLAAPVGALVDGRDIGTVVFPDADLKVFLTASLEERSRRRLGQLEGRGVVDEIQLQDIMKGLARRDERDGNRAAAPLKQAPDAVVLDTSSLNVEETVQAMIALLRERGLLT
jgi:cytidylate kinase